MSTSGSGTYHHGELRAALFDAALALLAEDGADALSLRAVARRAGVSAMAPYRHYPDKGALLAALAAHGFRGLCGALREADEAAPPGRAMVGQAIAYVRFALANPALFRLMFGPRRMDVAPPAELIAAGDATYRVLSDRVAAEAAPGRDREALTVGCWAIVHGLAGLFLDGQISDRIDAPDEIATRRVAEAMLTGLMA